MSQLQTALQAEISRVDTLKNEYEKYKILASTEEEKATAFVQQIQDSLGHGRNRERWIAFGINLIAGLIMFVLGVLLSPIVMSLLGIEP